MASSGALSSGLPALLSTPSLGSLDRPVLPHYARVARLTCPGSLNAAHKLNATRHALGRIAMTVYEMRTYTLHVGKMGEAVKLYTEFGYPALQKGGQDKKLIGYFQADTGTINQLVHLWKFDDDADRRAHWASVFANKDFVEGFAVKFRPLLASQEVKLLTAAPWGPHP
jgi:hypothetical protein